MIYIVILNWNGATMLQRFLPSVLKNSEGAEVVVADNDSTDNSLQVMADEFPSVRTIVLDRNYGFAGGYNRALEVLRRSLGDEVGADDYYLLLNSDVEVSEGWLKPLHTYMAAHPECAACQPKLRQWTEHHEDEQPRFEYAGGCGGYIDRYGYPYCRGRVFGTVEEDHGQYDDVAPVLWATGAALMIRIRDWEEAGGLDDRFFAHQEEIDLCWRLRARGRMIVCCPQSVVYHVGGGTLPQGSPRKTYLNFRNNLLLLYKNLPEAELQHVMRMRRWLDLIAALKELLTFNWANYRAIRQARRDFHDIQRSFEPQRKENLEKTTLYIIRERARMSLLWQYYLRRRTTYAQLPCTE